MNGMDHEDEDVPPIVRLRLRAIEIQLPALPAHERLLFNAIYDRDTYEHERLLEQKYQLDENFLALQEEIDAGMRYFVVEWFSNVVTDFGFSAVKLMQPKSFITSFIRIKFYY
ncbi:unnamed protein product [Gongylonema pulchrum]|uniref:Uncharacterized protein n=1 Tax=Gongylonema pulchrum TaxID=637853 RepID=A0A3P6QN27_9BILA|nr:unnamed protein product [Gongylonema pulchrum]